MKKTSTVKKFKLILELEVDGFMIMQIILILIQVVLVLLVVT